MNLPLREFADVVSGLKGGSYAISGNESRSASRMIVSARLEVQLIENSKVRRSFSVLTRDISLTGIGLLQSVPLLPGRELVLSLPRPAHSPLFVRATVKHCRTLAEGLLAVGLAFNQIIDEAASNALLADAAGERARVQKSILD